MTELKVGDKAPLFEAKDQHGNLVKLTDFQGKKVILYFYPKDNTTGCTAQACDLRDNYGMLQEKNYVVIGISTDNEASHQKFIDNYKLPFLLIADTDKKVHELYGTWQEKKMYGRTFMGTARITFIVDEQGVIANIINKVNTKAHVNQIVN